MKLPKQTKCFTTTPQKCNKIALENSKFFKSTDINFVLHKNHTLITFGNRVKTALKIGLKQL